MGTSVDTRVLITFLVIEGIVVSILFIALYLAERSTRKKTGSNKTKEDTEEFQIYDLAPYLSRYWKDNNGLLDSKSRSKFELILTEYLNQGHRTYDGFFRDARYTFHLRYAVTKTGIFRKKPEFVTIAGVGFDVGDNGIVSVVQIQGVKGKTDTLKTLKWERMLLAVVVQWAREHGYKEVRVQRGEKNLWKRHGVGEASFKMHYDVTAKRSGFSLDSELDCFRLELN